VRGSQGLSHYLAEVRCQPTLKVFAFVSTPLNMHSACTLPCSLYNNNIGPEGGSALAAILSQTKITDLKWVAISNPDHSARFPVSAP